MSNDKLQLGALVGVLNPIKAEIAGHSIKLQTTLEQEERDIKKSNYPLTPHVSPLPLTLSEIIFQMTMCKLEPYTITINLLFFGFLTHTFGHNTSVPSLSFGSREMCNPSVQNLLKVTLLFCVSFLCSAPIYPLLQSFLRLKNVTLSVPKEKAVKTAHRKREYIFHQAAMHHFLQ